VHRRITQAIALKDSGKWRLMTVISNDMIIATDGGGALFVLVLPCSSSAMRDFTPGVQAPILEILMSEGTCPASSRTAKAAAATRCLLLDEKQKVFKHI